MSTLPAPAATLRTARLHLVNWPQTLGWPWGIVAIAWAISLAVMAVVPGETRDTINTGGLASLYVMAFVVYNTAMTQWFAFAVGLSVSRTRWYAATALTAAAQAVVFAAVLVALLAVEQATGGWGLQLTFFGAPFAVVGNPLGQLVVFAAPLLALAYVGMATGVIYSRWGMAGILGTVIAYAVLVAGLVMLITWRQAWPAVGDFLTTKPQVLLLGALPALKGLLALVLGYALVRRATP
jgi:hypothetical protein